MFALMELRQRRTPFFLMVALPAVMRELRRTGMALFHEVDSVADFHKALTGPQLLVGPRDTFYGMREIFVKDPAGFVHGYAQKISTGKV